MNSSADFVGKGDSQFRLMISQQAGVLETDSTLLAATLCDRRFIGVEPDPEYLEIATERLLLESQETSNLKTDLA